MCSYHLMNRSFNYMIRCNIMISRYWKSSRFHRNSEMIKIEKRTEKNRKMSIVNCDLVVICKLSVCDWVSVYHYLPVYVIKKKNRYMFANFIEIEMETQKTEMTDLIFLFCICWLPNAVQRLFLFYLFIF